MPGKMDCFGQTDRGLRRPSNEDHFLIADLNKALRIHQTSLNFDDEETLFGISQGMMLLVADGMGGHAAGEHASRLTVESLTHSILNCMPWFFSRDAEGDDDLRSALERALHRCQQRLQSEARAHPSVQGMGTTLTAAYVHWPRATIVHAGDSRCYLLRGTELKQITRDHTLAQQIVEESEFHSPDILQSRWAHVLWNAIGSGNEAVKPEVHQFDLQIGDVLLLCTDGLTKHVQPPEIRRTLSRNNEARATCQLLIDETLAGGGADNVTVVIARFVDENPQSERIQAIAEESLVEANLQDTVAEMAAITEAPAELEEIPELAPRPV
ncbi:Serine/threonine phosphatase stp [Caulifigura coniformis]|uniref:Serine/threonine phosphatase stp n=1 Tax=Caulifigura coniformis TaxID=2527983 RepID=A0A517S8Y3_9PLAN|nr:protein phosphatase 2C domain-containing protein [Caulifigura coniformis]QDT52569.1 Serine/threonine phosphatase stp [Caulifigura coniformis]